MVRSWDEIRPGRPRDLMPRPPFAIAFCAMAGNDDRGNRERRFATIEEILCLFDVPPDGSPRSHLEIASRPVWTSS